MALLVALRAAADPASLAAGYSAYERQAIDDAETQLGARMDPSPAGKWIEQIDFVRLDPIDPHDPAPAALDLAHATTRAFVLRRELLVAEGARWQDALIDESARNLRALPQLSLVLCVAFRGSSPARVRLVVITKDVWSLYVDFDLDASLQWFNELTFQPKETNVAGLHHAVTGQLVLSPESYSIGARYEIPRLDGRRLSLAVEGNAVIHRSDGRAEGSYGTARVERPLFSSMTAWAGSATFAWNDTIARTHVNGRLKRYVAPGGVETPWQYRERTISELLHVTRSLGWERKNDLSVGFSASLSRYSLPDAASLDPRAAIDFVASVVPLGEDRVGPFVEWHSYTRDFSRVLDVDTLSLQEDERLGHEVWLRLYPVLRALGSTRDVLGAYGAAAYTAPFGDGFARAGVDATIEAQTDRVADASATAALAVVTPRTAVGRLVFEASGVDRLRNHLNAVSYLGGDGRLRGYPTNAFFGRDRVVGNLELRSRALRLASTQWGGVAFYDFGDAFDGFDRLRPKQSIGFGFRLVLPQIERAVFRLDVGFPVGANAPRGIAPVAVSFAFHQAAPVPSIGAEFAP